MSLQTTLKYEDKYYKTGKQFNLIKSKVSNIQIMK